MRTRLCWFWLLAAGACRAEVIDRIALTVGSSLITESDVFREIRLTAFLNGAELDSSGPARRKTAERLVEQTLIRRELELSRYTAPEMAEAEQMLSAIRRDRFPEEARYRQELEKYKIVEEDLKQHLLRQLATLRFIDLRFKPGVQILEPEVEEYYQKKLLPQWREKGAGQDPPLEEVRRGIEEILVAGRVDHMLEEWIKEVRAGVRIEFREKVFE